MIAMACVGLWNLCQQTARLSNPAKLLRPQMRHSTLRICFLPLWQGPRKAYENGPSGLITLSVFTCYSSTFSRTNHGEQVISLYKYLKNWAKNTSLDAFKKKYGQLILDLRASAVCAH
jgi:hypothetical protein